MKWHHAKTPRKKKFEIAPSAGSTKPIVSGYDADVILVTSLPIRRRVNSGRYDETPSGPECSFSCSIHTKKFENYFSLKKKKKFGPHSSVHHWDPHKIRIHIVTSPLTQPHSPDIAPSDFHHFCLWKDGLLGQHYMDEALQNTVQQWRANFTCR